MKDAHDAFREDEPLIDGLELPAGSLDLSEPDPAVRDVVLRETLRVQRARRIGRGAGRVAAAALLFGIGFAVARLASPERARVVPAAAELAGGGAGNGSRDAGPSRGAAPSPSDRSSDPGARESRPDDPEILEERAARASAPERADLFRRAGDAYLVARGDVEEAMRCYRIFLGEAPADFVPDPAESWLLVAMMQRG